MKIYLRGALFRSKRTARVVQVVHVLQDGPDVWYDLKPLVKGRKIHSISHEALERFYTPMGMGLIEPEGDPHPSPGIEPEEKALQST